MGLDLYKTNLSQVVEYVKNHSNSTASEIAYGMLGQRSGNLTSHEWRDVKSIRVVLYKYSNPRYMDPPAFIRHGEGTTVGRGFIVGKPFRFSVNAQWRPKNEG